MTDSAVADLPDPDSPTTATTSPAPTVRSTPRTAATGGPSVGKVTVSPRTSSSAVTA